MNTEDIMKLSLTLAGLKHIPEDTTIYVNGRNLKRILFCIDAGVPELLLAKQLSYDAVIAHHPAGSTALINHHLVFNRHIQQMVEAGIPKKEAEKAVSRKLEQLEVDAHTRNYDHAVHVARLLKIPYMNIHTPLDEIGRRIMKEKIQAKTNKNSTVQDVISALDTLTEFKKAITKIKVRVGNIENPAGNVVVSHGAGTNGGYEIARTYFEHGINTVIYIHIAHGDLERLRADCMGNLIITGHIASDSIGINPFIHELEGKDVSVTMIGVIPS